MPRAARKRSIIGVYHVIARGINRQTLFEDETDNERFIHTLRKYKEICGYELYAYCLMGNHLHLLLKEEREPIETIMQKMCGSYALWYNNKYHRVGHLFQDRYKSEPVEDDRYFLTVLRYIFRNPVKAGIVKKVEDYACTNYMDYINEDCETNIEFALNIFHSDRKTARRQFIEFINTDSENDCLDIAEYNKLSDEEAKIIIKIYCQVAHAIDLEKLDSGIRNKYLKGLKKEKGLSIRQLERLTGINRGIIQRA